MKKLLTLGSVALLATGAPVLAETAENAVAEAVAQQTAAVGKEAPDFTLKNHQGADVSLSEYEGKKNVLLIFSRAYW